MSRLFADYLERAKQILDQNWVGSSTKPSPSLYPHQWNWDSGFIAIGLSHYNTSRAITEIEPLFEAQWSNGMLPQIVFNPDAQGHYFPEPDFWQTGRSPWAPAEKLTSGITMPPVHAVAVEKIFRHASKPFKQFGPADPRTHWVVSPVDARIHFALLSEIFRWYERDFGGGTVVLDFIFDYLADDRARRFIRQELGDIRLEYIYYDWNLNR
jgi:hypothetical protein